MMAGEAGMGTTPLARHQRSQRPHMQVYTARVVSAWVALIASAIRTASSTVRPLLAFEAPSWFRSQSAA